MSRIKSQNKKIYFFIFFALIIFLQGIFLIPPLDRDESRFASASKNMIETNDYIDIRLENESRYKKPVGIYWAQSLTTILLGKPPYDKIWTYRIPSLFGILLSIILIFLSIKKIFNQDIALLTSFFLSTSLLLISEINQAKSDGLLFLFINICNLIILKNISRYENNKFYDQSNLDNLIFWCSLGLGTLIKGPIIIIFVGVPLLSFCLIKKDFYFVKSLHSFSGYLVYSLIVFPWFILITIKSGSSFWHESVINDLLNKVKSGQESHGFFPGYYTLLLFLFFWPGCTFLTTTIKSIFLNFSNDYKGNLKLLYLICSFLPCFLLYELIPTKLPHYVLPAYPALSILTSIFIIDAIRENKDFLYSKVNTFCLLLYPIAFISLLLIAIIQYSKFEFSTMIISLYLMAITLFIAYQFFLKKNIKKFFISCFVFQISVYLCLVHYMTPKLETFWIAKKINNIIEINSEELENIYHYGFNEPSLVFMIGHKSQRLIPEVMLKKIRNFEEGLFVLTEKEASIFDDLLQNDQQLKLLNSFEGFNYSKGKKIKFYIFKN
ncbi:glycosyltransferase family 39 protein [Rickettsiales bacterium]|nr:glycosyltransferase family 39 protein [Rickettsiales bacterium]